MKISKKNKATFFLFVYSFIVKVMANYSLNLDYATFIVSPVFFMIFTWMCMEEYKRAGLSTKRIISTILVGALIVTLPIRIFYFQDTMGSLPQEILCVFGICAGWLLSYKPRIWLLLLFLLLFVSISLLLSHVGWLA